MTELKLTPDTKLKRRAEIMSRRVDDETVLLAPETGQYFALNETGTEIWNLIEDSATLTQVQTSLLDRFEVEHDEAWNGMVELLAKLIDLGLAEIVAD